MVVVLWLSPRKNYCIEGWRLRTKILVQENHLAHASSDAHSTLASAPAKQKGPAVVASDLQPLNSYNAMLTPTLRGCRIVLAAQSPAHQSTGLYAGELATTLP
jgi:hypothetical protein